MNMHRRFSNPDPWVNQIFMSPTARKGGMVYRSKTSVERECGAARLELEVRRRGFRMVETEGFYAIFCSPGPIKIIC